MKKGRIICVLIVLACFLAVNFISGEETNSSEDGNDLSAADKRVCPADGWYNSSEPFWINASNCDAELRQDIEYRVYENNSPCKYNITATNQSIITYLNNDSDGDGVCDYNDICEGTSSWYAEVELNPNHYDSSNWNASEACGCNCKQILDLKPGNDWGEYDYGCTSGTRNVWENMIGWAEGGICRKDMLSWLMFPSGMNNQPQNVTFAVNAIAQCFASDCGIVSGALFYNGSSIYPSEAISSNLLSKPFYVIGDNLKDCGQMNSGDICNLTWIVNATGEIGESYKISAYFDSKNKKIDSSMTFYAIIKIISPTFGIILSEDLFNVKFNNLNPGSEDNPAVNNSNNGYSILCDYSAGRCNVSIKANGDMVDGANNFKIGNVSWWRENDASFEKRFSFDYNIINETLGNMEKQLIYLWLDAPSGQTAGNYRSNFTIEGLPN